MTGAEVRDLIVSLTDSLAWPASAVIALWILRPFLWKLGTLIETIRYKDLELSFRRTVLDAAERAESLVAVEDPIVEDSLPETLDTDPRITLIKSWASVETAIETLAKVHRIEQGQIDPMTTHGRVEMLRQAKVINDEEASIMREMQAGRNLIVHGRDIPLNEEIMRTFSRTAVRLASLVERRL